MDKYQQHIHKAFGGKLRIRICGILIENNKILLIKHKGVGEKGYLWSPPGGGAAYGESTEDTLKREFLEETALHIDVGKFLFFHEYINLPLHAIELFFEVRRAKGKLSKGIEPEVATIDIIEDIAFKSLEEIKKDDPAYYHATLLNSTCPLT